MNLISKRMTACSLGQRKCWFYARRKTPEAGFGPKPNCKALPILQNAMTLLLYQMKSTMI